jgi:signal transduction histidine kinase
MTMLPWIVAGLSLLFGAICLLVGRASRRRDKAREEELARRTQESDEQRKLLRTLLDASPLAVVLCADSGRIVFENEPARAMFFDGRSAEGENFLRLVADGPEPFRGALLGATDEMVGLTVEGRREIYHFARRSFEYGGQPHTLMVVRTMTREVARHDIDVLKNVVRLISHEVNNSLAPVSSLVHSARSILRGGDRLERLDRVFDTIDERSKHLSNFIAGYATLARLPRPIAQPVEWGAMVNRLAVLFPEATLEAPVGATGYCDAGQLEQALINLLRNATQAGGPATEVRLTVVPHEQGGAELCVVDRGAGFSPEALESALLPFYTTKPGGSGVGLALVREVVQAHEGRLSLSQRQGGGAAVSVWLPGRQRPSDPSVRARLTLTRA